MLQQLIANGFVSGALIALLAVGFGVLYSTSRFFVFTFGASFSFAAYTFLLCARAIPIGLSVLIGVGLGVAVGVALEAGVYRRLRSRSGRPLVLMIASIGAYIVLQNLLSLSFGDAARSVRFWEVQEGYAIFGSRVSGVQILTVLVAAVVLCLTSAFLFLTGFGRNLRAIQYDPALAEVVGVRVNGTMLRAVALGSGIAGIAGILTCLDTDVVPTMGFQGLLLGVVASVIGGAGSLEGAIPAGFLLGFAQQLAVWKLPAQWQDCIVFLVLIAFLLLRPQGFHGRSTHKANI